MSLPPYQLIQWFATAEGRFDLSLSHSACETRTAADFLDEDALSSIATTPLEYGPFDGLPELRSAISNQYTTVDASQVLTFNGPSEAIYTFMRAMLKPGDQVVVQSPAFHTLHTIARQIGCEVREWRPADEVSWAFDVAELEGLCTNTTKLIVINFPHNPTGQMISSSQLRRIADIAKANDALLFGDEVFRLLELPPYARLPAVCDIYEKGISMSGMSKPFGMGGLRIGWLATHCDTVRDSVKQYRYYTAEMTNTPCQLLACAALQKADEILLKNRAMILANLDRLEAFVASHADTLKLSRPKAGTMAVVEQRLPLTSTELCEQLLNEERLFLIPGKPLGISDRLLRFGLGRSDFELGLQRLHRFLGKRSALGVAE